MNAVDGPLAVFCKVVNDPVEITERGSGVWPLDNFAKIVKGRVPLVSIFVKIGNSAPVLKV